MLFCLVFTDGIAFVVKRLEPVFVLKSKEMMTVNELVYLIQNPARLRTL